MEENRIKKSIMAIAAAAAVLCAGFMELWILNSGINGGSTTTPTYVSKDKLVQEVLNTLLSVYNFTKEDVSAVLDTASARIDFNTQAYLAAKQYKVNNKSVTDAALKKYLTDTKGFTAAEATYAVNKVK